MLFHHLLFSVVVVIGTTTILLSFRRMMLSAAHALAMDAKNLLDVVDSIRIRYPEVNDRLTLFFSEANVQETVQSLTNSISTGSQGPPIESGPSSMPSSPFHKTSGEESTATSFCTAEKAPVEQPIYEFATKIPAGINSSISYSKNC